MAVIALVLYLAFGALALGGRLWVQWSRTGSTGYRGLSRRLGPLGLVGGISFIVAMVGGLAAPFFKSACGDTVHASTMRGSTPRVWRWPHAGSSPRFTRSSIWVSRGGSASTPQSRRR